MMHCSFPIKICILKFCDYFNLQDVDGTWQLQSYVPGTVAWGRGIYDPKLEVDIFFTNSSAEIFLYIKKTFSPDPL